MERRLAKIFKNSTGYKCENNFVKSHQNN